VWFETSWLFDLVFSLDEADKITYHADPNANYNRACPHVPHLIPDQTGDRSTATHEHHNHDFLPRHHFIPFARTNNVPPAAIPGNPSGRHFQRNFLQSYMWKELLSRNGPFSGMFAGHNVLAYMMYRISLMV
jgi:hypothetical protein